MLFDLIVNYVIIDCKKIYWDIWYKKQYLYGLKYNFINIPLIKIVYSETWVFDWFNCTLLSYQKK